MRFSASNKGTAGRVPIVGNRELDYRRAKRLIGTKLANEQYPEFNPKKGR